MRLSLVSFGIISTLEKTVTTKSLNYIINIKLFSVNKNNNVTIRKAKSRCKIDNKYDFYTVANLAGKNKQGRN